MPSVKKVYLSDTEINFTLIFKYSRRVWWVGDIEIAKAWMISERYSKIYDLRLYENIYNYALWPVYKLRVINAHFTP